MAKLKITQVRSTIRTPQRQKRTMEALGLRRIGHSREHVDTKELQGMLTKISHLVTIEKMDA